jgi:hypothetical protein
MIGLVVSENFETRRSSMIETIEETQNTSNLAPAVNSAYRGWKFLLMWVGLLVGVSLFLYIYVNLSGYATVDIFSASEDTLRSFGFVALNLLNLAILSGMIGTSVGLVQWLGLKQRIQGWILYSMLGAMVVLILNWSISYSKFMISVNSLGASGAGEAKYMAEAELQTGIQDALVAMFPKISNDAMEFISSSITGPLFIGALLGLGMGILQWLMLRRTFRWSGWWILASVLGWGLGSVAANLMIFLAPSWIPDVVLQSQWQFIIVYGLSGAVGLGLVLGLITGGTLIWLAKKPQPVKQEVESIEELTTAPEADAAEGEVGPAGQ